MKTICIIIAPFLLLVAGHALAASFDCSKAQTKVEKRICASKQLSALDEQLGKEYAKTAKLACKASDLRTVQKVWLALRDRSETDWDMARRYEERIKELKQINGFPVTVDASISPQGEKYHFRIEPETCIDYAISPTPRTFDLTITNEAGKKVQTIGFEVGTFFEADSLLWLIDMDGDGYQDFKLLGFYGVGPFPYSALYRFDPERREFVEDSSFPGGFQMETPAERDGCVYVEERVGGADYTITEWCLDRDTNAWGAERTCSRVQDKECVDRIDAYRKKWEASHRFSK